MKFSVLLSIYRNEDATYFSRAMTSIWDDQTVKPSEIVLVKDGLLTEKLDASVAAWQQKLGSVLKVVPLLHNVGLGSALNKGLQHCSHNLVARMDTDDISLPCRFEKQMAFMRENPQIMVSSAWIEEFDQGMDKTLGIRKVPQTHDEIVRFAKRRNPLSHPVVIFQKCAVLEVGGYPQFRKAQDYALWSLMLQKGYRMANLSEVLLYMRTGHALMARRGFSYLRHEIALLWYQKKIGLLDFKNFFINLCIRSAVRLPPSFLKRLLYKVARKERI